ncbi:MAG: hypothetical protein GWN02_11970 [Gemmatimonadetes bacterium]|nr:hypothetical protein [Gemmatimonadota bacterium]NIR36886.1 hypothetical protein [Actinomycetota bacterium]NIS31293.1 hypothetical protein [Actinomycetota bacterium]NIT95582.1 hypothetical protein [Actinomycetota bacterium]NIU66413.1 hypothetical protein [Actinomycetota bacterium]
MSDPAIPLEEFDQEMDSTRRLLERVPSEKGPWKPHEKSFPLGHLAQLVSWMPGWIASTLRETELDFEKTDVEYSFEPTETLLEIMEKGARESRRALQEVTGQELDVEWTLRSGDFVMYSAPRRVAARGHLNHLIHHRGQLTVYLRLLDVPLPPIYGPTADER